MARPPRSTRQHCCAIILLASIFEKTVSLRGPTHQTARHQVPSAALVSPTESVRGVHTSSRLHMSTSSSSYSQGKARNQSRNRGANAANRNRRGHAFRLENSDGRQRPKKKTKRAPRWEREGDDLYQEISKQLQSYQRVRGEEEDGGASEHLLSLAKTRISNADDVYRSLEPWTCSDDEIGDSTSSSSEPAQEAEEPKSTSEKTPPFMWGSLSVGPVIANRLRESERASPTPVQRAAFPILTAGLSKGNKKVPTKRANAIIASPTGTGKTLSYLLPLLCTSPGGQHEEGTGGVVIVTPTIELACQIQREVDVLWPPIENESSLFVVGAEGEGEDELEAFDGDDTPQGRTILRAISQAPLIAGTPKMLRMLYREAGRVVRQYRDDSTITKEDFVKSKALVSNMRAIVLDEADRLLRTEAAAREATERKQRKMAEKKAAIAAERAIENYMPPPAAARKRRLIVARQTQTELLLRDLPIKSLDDVQIICASATIGRTMRRQMMQILDATSADAAATLITGEEDQRVKSKDASKRRSVLLPAKLQHAYRVVDGDAPGSAADLAEDLSVAERNEEKRISDTLNTLWDTMASLEAKPLIVFPGKVGVERVQQDLVSRGLSDVRTLRNLQGDDVETAQLATPKDWMSTPVYVIGERFARGLDLPEVGYVVLLSPPSSAAGYAHMAGRTGRSGREGVAFTLVRPKNNEVQRLAAISEALGLRFRSSLSRTLLLESEADARSRDEDEVDPPLDPPEPTLSWEGLSDSAMNRKKKDEMQSYLSLHGKDFVPSMTKAELISEIQKMHSK